ncbi:hypothetical protein DY000_02045539 [Brassica cretica]|uniref:Uncharacterized protein n=1 Tax=Brassica cretica TaxID=69181 RepID=A0ABQ7F4C3_BRACR|nr:hypothetical protein DY000_02045539 [Brassica cretica]
MVSSSSTLKLPRLTSGLRHEETEPEDYKKLKEDQGFMIRNITSLFWERSPILMTILVNERDEFQNFPKINLNLHLLFSALVVDVLERVFRAYALGKMPMERSYINERMANSFMYWNDCVEPDDLDAMWMDPVAVADITVRRHFDSILDPFLRKASTFEPSCFIAALEIDYSLSELRVFAFLSSSAGNVNMSDAGPSSSHPTDPSSPGFKHHLLYYISTARPLF